MSCVETEWEMFRDIVECSNDECGVRRVGGKAEKGVSGGVKKLVWWWPKREELSIKAW